MNESFEINGVKFEFNGSMNYVNGDFKKLDEFNTEIRKALGSISAKSMHRIVAAVS